MKRGLKCTWRRRWIAFSIGARARSPMKRGLKCQPVPDGAPLPGLRARALPDEEGTEIHREGYGGRQLEMRARAPR